MERIRPAAQRLPSSADLQQQQQQMGMSGRMGSYGNGGMQANATPGDVLRQALGQALGGTPSGGFNWGAHGGLAYEDDGLKAIKAGGSNLDTDKTAYFIERVVGAMDEFIKQIYYRMGTLYDVYKQTRDNFPVNALGQVCPVRHAFIEAVKKQHDFTRVVAWFGGVFFGRRLIDQLERGAEQFQPNEYLAATEMAVRNVFYFELINWLMKSQQGQQFARALPEDLQQKTAQLESFKDIAASAFDTFGQTSPYSHMEFKRPESTRPDFAALYGHYGDMFGHERYDRTEQVGAASLEMREIMQEVHKNAAAYRGDGYRPPSNVNSFGESFVNYNQNRTDFQNLTPQNRDEFNVRQYFRQIGKPDHYFIPEHDWKNIKRAFRKHADQGPEETVQPNCFRIVIINLNADTGWFSRVVRSRSMTMQDALSNPEKLLPLLTSLEDPELYNVTSVALKEVSNKTNMTVPVANGKKLTGIPVISVEEAITCHSDSELDATILAGNNTIVKNFTNESATAFDAIIWDTFDCARAEDKTRLFNDLPFLFKDHGLQDGPNFYQAARALRTFVAQGIVGETLTGFINNILTGVTNNWLVNACGYTVAKGTGSHLAIGSFMEDMEDLSNALKERDPTAYQHLHANEDTNPLIGALRIFDHAHPFEEEPKEGEEVSQLRAAKKELELVVQRRMYVVNVNGRGGPNHLTQEPVIMSRSSYPEYFHLIEEGFSRTMGDDTSYDTTDKLLYFPSSDNLWLFTYSVFDANVATLRHVNKAKKRVLMPMD